MRRRNASLKGIGEKTANLFDRKKKEAAQLAAEKLGEAQHYAEEQAKKADESLLATKNEVDGILTGAADELKANASAKIDNANQSLEEASTFAEQSKKAAQDALKQGATAVELTANEQLSHAENAIDGGMKILGNLADQKIREASTYVDHTREDVEKKIHDATVNAQGVDAANLLGKLSLGRPN